MPWKEHLRQDLVKTRRFSEQLLADFRRPEEWVYQVHPHSNHALWFAGHLGHADNFFISMVRPELAAEPDGFAEVFGTGSEPTPRAEDYPAIDSVLDYMRDRRKVLLTTLDSLSDDELNAPTAAGSPAFLSTIGSVFQMASWHECMHAGQLTVARRALGHPPLMAAPPTPTPPGGRG